MLLDEFMPVMAVGNCGDLRKEVVRFARSLGFETVGAFVFVDRPGDQEVQSSGVDNAPPSYSELFADREGARVDPVMQHCKRSSLPIVWNQDTYVRAGRGPMWEAQAEHGYCTGISVALHLSQGRHFVFGVERDKALLESPVETVNSVARLQLFVMHAQEAAMRVLLPALLPDVCHERLTGRERESLCWTMEGKTAWEVGNILGISEQTAARHVNNATQKLGCVNKLQAVVKALRLGLIH